MSGTLGVGKALEQRARHSCRGRSAEGHGAWEGVRRTGRL